MQLGNLTLNPFQHLAAELSRLRDLDDDAIEPLCTLIDADDVSDLVRKIGVVVTASVWPGSAIGRILEESPTEAIRLCVRVGAYRDYMDALDNDEPPTHASSTIERSYRLALERIAFERGGGLDSTDVRTSDGALDPERIHVEVEHLLRRLGVQPELIEVRIMKNGAIDIAITDRAGPIRAPRVPDGDASALPDEVDPEKTPTRPNSD